MFTVYIEEKVNKDLQKIPTSYKRLIFDKIDKILSDNPFPHANNPKKLKGDRVYRLRIGNYRVLYKINDNKVLVYAVKHRKEAY